MQNIFLSVLDMSITASLVILAVILARLLLKKAPKKFSYALWALVLLRLLCPWSIESVLSLIPEKTQSIPQSIALEESISGNIGAFEAFDAAQRAVGDTLNGGVEDLWVRVDTPETEETETVSASHTQVWLLAAGYVWLIGMAAMLLWSGVSYLRLRRRLRTAVRAEDDIWLADGIDSPFVMGIFMPKIYLPSTLAEAEKSYIIAHERCHIRRRDHIIKLLAFAALTLHWFNPLVWLAFALYSRDMEMSCDEAVIGQLGEDIRADYSASLLSLATGRRAFAGTPLAFGEGDPKGRIKNLAAWKKPALWLSAVAVVVLIAAAVCLLTDPESHGAKMDRLKENIITEDGYTITNQRMVEVELSVPKSALPEGIYSERHDFAENELVVYDDGTTSIWLEYVMPANETDELLYFSFACSYELPKESGSFLSTLEFEGGGSTACSTAVGTGEQSVWDDVAVYPDAVSLKGMGSGERFVFCVSTEVVKAAEGNMRMLARLNELWYRKAGFAPDLPVTDGGGRSLRSADVDHDGVGELVGYWEEDGAYYLRVQESDGTIIWESEALAENHAGWTSYLLYSEDGEDYLVEYCPGMWQGVGRYHCSVFHIRNRVEVELRRWTVDFELPTEITADMAAFAENANAMLEKSRLLLSTLGGEVVIGPVVATEVPAVYPVTFYADSSPAYTVETEEEQLCREAFAALGKAEYLHFTTEYYLDGMLCADMPRDEGWISGSDWLLRSELVNEQGDHRQLLLEKDGVQYAWMKISDKEEWLQSADGTYDSNMAWLFDGWGDALRFIGEEQTEEGRELSFEEIYYGESGETMVGCIQIYRFDADGGLRAIIRTGGSAAGEGQEFTVVYSFPRCSPDECAEAIDAAYAQVPEDVQPVMPQNMDATCRGLLAQQLSEDYLHYTAELGTIGPDGTAYNSENVNVWVHGGDWLSVKESQSIKTTSLAVAMHAYGRMEIYSANLDTGWSSAGGSYELTDIDEWFFGEKSYDMELVAGEDLGDGTFVYRFRSTENIMGYGEGVILGSGQRFVDNTEEFFFDGNELCSVKITANLENESGERFGMFVTYTFQDASESDCAEAIDEVYAEVKTALGLN